MKTDLPVREAMVTKVVTMPPEGTALDAAKLMKQKNMGSVVIVDAKSKAIGIVTEKDFLRLAATDKRPSETKIKEIMSSKLLTIPPDMSIIEAAKLMNKKKFRKLPVVHNKSLIGIITAEDIIRVAPTEMELLLELARIKGEPLDEEFATDETEGECETCGKKSKGLIRVADSWVCDTCKESLEEEA